MKTRFVTLVLFAAVAAFNPVAAWAADYKVGDITIHSPWARATFAMAKTGVAYVTIRNEGDQADRLVAASAEVAKKADLHESLMEDGVMKMRPAGAIEIPAGGMAMLEPGGYHIMFMGLVAPFKEGESFPLTLVFERAGRVDVMVDVLKAGSMGDTKMKHAD